MPLPSDPKVIFLGGLFALALLATVYVAGEIVLPMAFAITLKLLLQPIMRILERLHVPRLLGALLLILALFGTIWVRPFRGQPGPGQLSSRRVFLDFKSG
jgi:predicted PurR-regulated permease PerM